MNKNENKPHIDQGFFNTFNPIFSFPIMGQEVKGRGLSIKDFKELKGKFKDWQGFDIGTLLTKHEFDALLEICWLGVRDLNPEIPTRVHLEAMINVHTFNEWGLAWRMMAGMPADEDVAIAEETSQKKDESSEIGDTSSA